MGKAPLKGGLSSFYPRVLCPDCFFDFPGYDGTWRKARCGRRDGFFPGFIASWLGRRFGFCRGAYPLLQLRSTQTAEDPVEPLRCMRTAATSPYF